MYFGIAIFRRIKPNCLSKPDQKSQGTVDNSKIELEFSVLRFAEGERPREDLTNKQPSNRYDPVREKPNNLYS